MENFEQLKNKENIIKKNIFLPDGKIFEMHYNITDKKMERFFIKDINGKLLEFTELKNIDFITPESVKHIFFNKGIALKEEEIEKIMLKLTQIELDSMLGDIDEKKDIKN